MKRINPISTSVAAVRQLLKPSAAPGASPGALPVGPSDSSTVIRALAYDERGFEATEVATIEELAPIMQRRSVTWIDVDGLGDIDKLKGLAEAVGLHPLALEDAVHSEQRAKAESYPSHDFIVVRMVSYDARVQTEQLSIFLGEGFVVTLQGGRPGDSLDPVRRRIREGQGRIRAAGAGYLAYALVDAVTDYYLPVLDRAGARLEELEQRVTLAELPDAPQNINASKHDLLALRRLIITLRDTVRGLTHTTGMLVSDEVRLYFRDTLDHTMQLLDVVDSYREVASGLMDIHFSIQGQRMNEIMKFLTLMSSIFIPLSFIAGVYGMNFSTVESPWNMPELRSPYGYPIVLGVMLALSLALLVFFWRRGWLK